MPSGPYRKKFSCKSSREQGFFFGPFLKNGMSVYFRHSLIFTPVMRIIAHVLSTGKKKTMNQGFTITGRGIIGRNC